MEFVAERLLDRVRVRKVTVQEGKIASLLLANSSDSSGRSDVEAFDDEFIKRVRSLCDDDSVPMSRWKQVADLVRARVAMLGRWDEAVEDSVPVQIQPLHKSAVKEALGALIPARLHKSLDEATRKGKDNFGPLRGGSVLKMDNWRVDVRAEDSLARGRLQDGALEFF